MAKRANKSRSGGSGKSPSPLSKKNQGPKKPNTKPAPEKGKTATPSRRARSASPRVENVVTAPLSASPFAWNEFRDEVAAQRQRLLAQDVFPEQQELSGLLETLAAAYSLLASRETLAPELAKAVVSQLSQQCMLPQPQLANPEANDDAP